MLGLGLWLGLGLGLGFLGLVDLILSFFIHTKSLLQKNDNITIHTL